MHSRSSTSFTSQMQDYVAPTPIDLRTCAAEGTKFFDLDADGVRDADEPGIPGFQIFADYDDNGQLDPGEPSTVSDSSGRYVLDDIRQRRSYRLRERLLPTRRRATNDWRCSFPNAGTDGGFGAASAWPAAGGRSTRGQEPNATGRDFGNWYPAQLTVTKELVPPDDPGRFDLFVNGETVFRERAGRVVGDARRAAGLLHRLRAGGPADRSEPVHVERAVQDPHAPGGCGPAPSTRCLARRRRPGDVHVPERPGRADP